MAAYSFTDQAIRDLDETCGLIAIDNPDAASQLFDDIRKQCLRVAKFPFSGKKYSWIRPNLRGFIIGSYVVLYTVEGENVLIVRVVSGYRDLLNVFNSDKEV